MHAVKPICLQVCLLRLNNQHKNNTILIEKEKKPIKNFVSSQEAENYGLTYDEGAKQESTL